MNQTDLNNQGLTNSPMRSPGAIRIAIKTCTPSKQNCLWGDTWFAMGLAKAFQRSGHHCAIHYREDWNQSGEEFDLTIHIKGLTPYQPVGGGVNVIWLISHPERHTPEELNQFDAVFCASRRYLDHIRPHLQRPCFYLPQAFDSALFRPPANPPRQEIDLLFVGVNYYHDKRRRIIEDVLAAGRAYNLWIIGQGWKGLVDQHYIKGDYILPHQLPNLYARAKIVLNDHHDTMRQWGFVNDRTYNLAAVKAFQIGNEMQELEQLGIVTYRSPKDLAVRLDHYLAHDAERQWRADVTHRRCRHLTFNHVAEQILTAARAIRKPSIAKPIRPAISESASIISAPNTPLVSVIMPAYNSERFIREAIDSILSQRFEQFELIVVDDGSTDQTVPIIRSYQDPRLRLIRQAHQYTAAATNRAIQEARGRFILGVDSDDKIEPNYLGQLVETARAYPDFDYYYPEIFKLMDADGRFQEPSWRYRDFEEASILPAFLFTRGFLPIPHPGALKRRAMFERTGLYRDQRNLIDFEFMTRNALNIRFKRAVNAVGYCYRWRPDSISRQMEHRNRHAAAALEAMVDQYEPHILCPPLREIPPEQRRIKFLRFAVGVFENYAKRHAEQGGQYYHHVAQRLWHDLLQIERKSNYRTCAFA